MKNKQPKYRRAYIYHLDKVSIDYSNASGFITLDLLAKYHSIKQKAKDNKIKDNSTIYQTPLSNYPVYKLKNYITENKLNIKKVRSFDKTDTVIISEYLLNDYKSKDIAKYVLVPGEEFRKEFESLLKDSYKYEDKTEYYYININDVNRNKIFHKYKNNPIIEGFPVSNGWGNKKYYDNIDLITNLPELIEKYNLDVILDSSLNEEINKGTVIDLESFENLYNMLVSNDVGNWNLAQEIISNSEYESSKPYIMFLASTFDFLKRKSNNKNYHIVHDKLWKEESMKYTHNTSNFITKVITTHPEYKQTICDCLRVHLNRVYRNDLIKEIKAS